MKNARKSNQTRTLASTMILIMIVISVACNRQHAIQTYSVKKGVVLKTVNTKSKTYVKSNHDKKHEVKVIAEESKNNPKANAILPKTETASNEEDSPVILAEQETNIDTTDYAVLILGEVEAKIDTSELK